MNAGNVTKTSKIISLKFGTFLIIAIVCLSQWQVQGLRQNAALAFLERAVKNIGSFTVYIIRLRLFEIAVLLCLLYHVWSASEMLCQLRYCTLSGRFEYVHDVSRLVPFECLVPSRRIRLNAVIISLFALVSCIPSYL